MKKIMWIYIRFVQKILIAIFLSLTYVLAFPLTWLFYMIFIRKKLVKPFVEAKTYWVDSEPIINSPENFENQS